MVSFDVPFARIDAKGLGGTFLTLVTLPLPVLASLRLPVLATERREGG
jgi:hypothetical protein